MKIFGKMTLVFLVLIETQCKTSEAKQDLIEAKQDLTGFLPSHFSLRYMKDVDTLRMNILDKKEIERKEEEDRNKIKSLVKKAKGLDRVDIKDWQGPEASVGEPLICVCPDHWCKEIEKEEKKIGTIVTVDGFFFFKCPSV